MGFVPQYSDYISQVKLPGSNTIYHIKDSEARQWIEELASAGIKFTVAWDGTGTPDVTKIPLGVTVTYSGQTYTGTLVASATTAPFIYLVFKKMDSTTGTRKIYEEYITVTQGTGESGDPYTYWWEELGDTDISIDNLGNMAYANTATGSVSVSGSTGTITSTGTFTAHGTVSKPTIDVDNTQTTSITGIATVGTLPSKDNDTFSAGTLPSFTEGSFSAGSLPSFTEGAFSAGTTPITVSVDSSETLTFATGTAPSKAADSFSAGTLPSKNADTWSAGTLPSFTEGSFNPGSLPTTQTAVSALTSVSAALHEAPTFTGTSGESISVTSSGVTVTSTGSVTVSPDPRS